MRGPATAQPGRAAITARRAPTAPVAPTLGEGGSHARGEVAVHPRAPPDLAQRLVVGEDDGRAARHRLQDGHAEALVARREDERGDPPVEPGELVRLDPAAHVRTAGAQLAREPGLLLGPRDDEPNPRGVGP